MQKTDKPLIFGEVLFDCFPDGKRILGGAPFNVAWHLHAFGDAPCFISRIGDDHLGNDIFESMLKWGLDTDNIQRDSKHPTGQVAVSLIDNEPSYTITPGCAYDFINSDEIDVPVHSPLLYHGTLGLRNKISREAYEKLASNPELSIFMDVNLRTPWWDKEDVLQLLQRARWVKLNQDELSLLSGSHENIQASMASFQERYNLDLLIVTVGAKGAHVRTREGDIFSESPDTSQGFVDTVGAGDAFTAVFLHGLLASKPLSTILAEAQKFASAVVGLRGAISEDPGFYQQMGY